MDTWLREWRQEVAPLRERFGFRVEGAWFSRDENRFAWVISYDSDDGFTAANDRYYASPQRLAPQPDPARHLSEIETTLMEAAP